MISCAENDIKIEMGVYEPVANGDDSVRKESRTGKDVVAGQNSSMPVSQMVSYVLVSSNVSLAPGPSIAPTNGLGTWVSDLGDAKTSTSWRNASVRIASKILKNSLQKRQRKARAAHQDVESSGVLKPVAKLDELLPESSGSGIRERLRRYDKAKVVCPICSKRFKWQSDLRKHMEEYQAHSALTCKVCGKVLTCKRQLRVHEKLHIGLRRHVCATCGKVYRHRSGLVMHSYEHTGQLPYLCDLCGAGFKNFFSMGQHKKRRHSTYRPFVCQQCGKGFIRNVLLRRHLKVHSGEKLNICPQCGMAFGYSGNLSRHLRSHVGDKPHSCGVCGRGFSRIDHLQSHALTHTKAKTVPGEYTCTECQKVFRSPWLLKRHTTIHSAESSFTCSICSKRFTGSTRLKQHMVTHEEKQHRCEICAKTFSFERFLMIHLKKCHQETVPTSNS